MDNVHQPPTIELLVRGREQPIQIRYDCQDGCLHIEKMLAGSDAVVTVNPETYSKTVVYRIYLEIAGLHRNQELTYGQLLSTVRRAREYLNQEQNGFFEDITQS